MIFRTAGTWTIRRGWRALPAIALCAIVVACGGGYGGGGGSGGTSYMPPPATTGPAGVAVGAITGFGSVHLNGKKFETTSATIHVDGQPATQADLHVGDIVEVKGHHDSASNTDIADVIEMHSNVQGPVGSIDIAGQRLVVLGQTVVVSSATSFGDGISPAALAGIAVGDILEVSGMPATTGDIQATRLEKLAAGATFHVSGAAATVDGTAKTLMINALNVDFSAATLVDFASTGPANGDLLEVDGKTLGSGGQLLATRLELRTGKALKADADGSAEVEGLVTRFASATDFDVAGRPVTTSSSTGFEGGAATDLALNVRVEVEGAVNATGVLAATKVRIERPADVRIVAQADSVDATAATVTVLGVAVSVNTMTRFEDHSSQKVETFAIANVHSGDWLDIRGIESPAGSGKVLATRLERRDGEPSVRLAGVVRMATPPNLTILSVTIATTPTTQFDHSSGGSGAAAFFAGAVGRTASVVGTWDGTTLTASKASLGESEDD